MPEDNSYILPPNPQDSTAAYPVYTSTTPTWTTITSLFGASLDDSNTLDGGSTGLNTSTGEFTFDFTGTIGNHDGFNDGPMFYPIPIGGSGNLLPDFDHDTDILEVSIQVTEMPADDTRYGIAIALLNKDNDTTAPSGVGAGFYTTTGAVVGLQSVTTLASQADGRSGLDYINAVFVTAGDESVKVTTETSTDDGSTWAEHGEIAGGDLDGAQDYLWVQGVILDAGSGAADQVKGIIHVKRIPRGTRTPS